LFEPDRQVRFHWVVDRNAKSVPVGQSGGTRLELGCGLSKGTNMPTTKSSWQKGRSGNPRGRPRSGQELGSLLRHMVDRRRFAAKLCELCYAGDVQAMRLLLAYTEGPPMARAEGEGVEGIQITVNYVQQSNRLELADATPGASGNNPQIQAVQRRLLRAPLRENNAGDGSADPSGTAR